MSLEFIILCVALHNELDKELSPEERHRRDRRNPRISIRRYNQSPFLHLYSSGNEQALLNCCGVDHAVFRGLMELYAPVFNMYMVDEATGKIRKRSFHRNGMPKGRFREANATCCLGLTLHWFRTRGSVARGLSMAFGLTSTVMYKWIKFSRCVLLYVLQDHPDARIQAPAREEIHAYIEAIGEKYPLLEQQRVWGAVDGLKLGLQKSSNWAVQNMFYNGWTCDTYVGSVFIFAPDGKIRGTIFNCPGSWHDSTISDYGIYRRMEEMYELYGAKVVVDAAFNLTDKQYLLRTYQKDPDLLAINNPNILNNNVGSSASNNNAAAKRAVAVNRQATSLRQLSEWGMRMIQGQFPRLKDRIRYEEQGERRILLHTAILLYNYQASTVGINQILNVFMPNEKHKKGFFSHDHTIDADANNLFW